MSPILFPVFVLEIETGDIKLINDEINLKILIEEFLDILSTDFKFWDKNGYQLIFGKQFLTNGTSSFERSQQTFEQELRSCLLNLARRKGKKLIGLEKRSLVDIYSMVDNDL
ncbi:hypothetical protein [Geotalea sp. SG265]|uniref:hypothetical protein n=1 Tax=Geotalea sp. SG265 TaxID=2922867 RepID=UPI001FAEDCD4|nr:hypothetical protein [Geotalea sp. SG265]